MTTGTYTTIYTNYNCNAYIDEAKEFLTDYYEAEGYEEKIDDEIYNKAWEFCNEDYDFYYDCMVKYLQTHNLIATGTVGTWQGPVEGGVVIETPREFLSLLEDCDYVEIGMDDEQMLIRCSHHDGTNYYRLKEMLEEDYDYYGEHRYDDRRKLCEYLFNRGLKPQIEWYL